MFLQKALRKTGILAEFIAKGTPQTSNAELMAWTKAHPALAGIEITYPERVGLFRSRMGCPAGHGGKREGLRNGSPVVVKGGRLFARKAERRA